METLDYQKTNDKMAIENPHILIITLNVNELNLPIKRHKVVDWIETKIQSYATIRKNIDLK